MKTNLLKLAILIAALGAATTGCVVHRVVYVPTYRVQEIPPPPPPPPTYAPEPPPAPPAASNQPPAAAAPPPAAPTSVTPPPPVVVTEPAPAPLVEVVPVVPASGYVWVPGYWSWQGRWLWVRGAWLLPPRPHAAWVSGHWTRHGRGYVWIGGHWR